MAIRPDYKELQDQLNSPSADSLRIQAGAWQQVSNQVHFYAQDENRISKPGEPSYAEASLRYNEAQAAIARISKELNKKERTGGPGPLPPYPPNGSAVSPQVPVSSNNRKQSKPKKTPKVSKKKLSKPRGPK